MVWEIGPADEETMKRRQVLARSVKEDLAVAGLPIAPDDLLFGPAGVKVTVDVMHDEHGGAVSVEWQAHYILRTAAMTAVIKRQSAGHPAVEHHVTASQVMRDAIAEILTTAGYTVLKDYNDLAPDQMKVTGHTPRTPSWRDWLAERRDEQTATMKATHRREHPGD
jgi:hypothetical protein